MEKTNILKLRRSPFYAPKTTSYKSQSVADCKNKDKVDYSLKDKRKDRRSTPKPVIFTDSMVKEKYDPNLSKDLQNNHHIIKI